MKLEMIGSASAGFFAVAGSWLAARGSAWEFLILATIGAVVAVLELDGWQPKKALLILLFNITVGTFGGPILLSYLKLQAGAHPPAVLLLVSFGFGWAAHSVFTDLRDVIMDWFTRWITKASK
ncbi:hypothetical protein [Ruegeria sp. Ofav3-42]|uniref:hypothetical protein n=1 Tax=Ruegeria sp. Ofav3-42 TaxID=2917759 RepID=UPI001EF68453|nr:hypothetical protein [Ruegeria sp. Ofav3-42]MCG7520841.1 hypothetical protein [Ruegeria sp. Ofav3-42]